MDSHRHNTTILRRSQTSSERDLARTAAGWLVVDMSEAC